MRRQTLRQMTAAVVSATAAPTHRQEHSTPWIRQARTCWQIMLLHSALLPPADALFHSKPRPLHQQTGLLRSAQARCAHRTMPGMRFCVLTTCAAAPNWPQGEQPKSELETLKPNPADTVPSMRCASTASAHSTLDTCCLSDCRGSCQTAQTRCNQAHVASFQVTPCSTACSMHATPQTPCAPH